MLLKYQKELCLAEDTINRIALLLMGLEPADNRASLYIHWALDPKQHYKIVDAINIRVIQSQEHD